MIAAYKLIENGIFVNRIKIDPALAPGWTLVLDDGNGRIGEVCDPQTGVCTPPALDRDALVAKIDAAVRAIYDKAAPSVIAEIYVERETAAQAFKNGGYIGTVPQRVAEFQVPAGLSAQVATDLILTQAAQLHGAKDALEAFRMRKYEVKNAASDPVALATAEDILAKVAFIGKNLP